MPALKCALIKAHQQLDVDYYSGKPTGTTKNSMSLIWIFNHHMILKNGSRAFPVWI